MVHSITGTPIIEQVQIIEDPSCNAVGLIALHSTTLGPAAGGCRLWHYADREAMAIDAIRLARGMSYKNALAGLPFGGGKAVLQHPGTPFDRRAMFEAFAQSVESLGGRYITAEDVGTTVADMELIAGHTRHVAGLASRPGKAGGDPSPWTALGLFKSLEAASDVVFGRDVRGLTVAVQGLGNVGIRLCRLLSNAGAKLVVADVDPARALLVARECGARVVSTHEVLRVEADILAPCALGAILDETSIPDLNVGLVCGGANNQLATDLDGYALHARGIAYAPDYVVNAGGIINIAAEYLGETPFDVQRRIEMIAGRVSDVLHRADRQNRPPHVIADDLARTIIANAQRAAA